MKILTVEGILNTFPKETPGSAGRFAIVLLHHEPERLKVWEGDIFVFMDSMDQRQWMPIAKKLYDLLEDQWKRFRRASSTVEMARYSDEGVQTFRLERRRAVQLLRDWFGPDEAGDFEALPAKLLNLHPSVLAGNRDFREWAKDEVETHAAYLFALMHQVKFSPLNLNGETIKKAHEVILRVFVDASEYPDANKSLELLVDEYGLVMDELVFHLDQLKSRNLLREVNREYVVTPKGLKELNRMENEISESLEQKRFRVLKTVYDMAPDDKHGWVNIYELAKVLDMNTPEVTRILNYWEQKGMVSWPAGQAVSLTAPAIDELEEKINHPTRPTQHFPYNVTYIDNSVNIEGGVKGNVVGGQGNTYNAITNDSISTILPKLAEFISYLKKTDFEDREDTIREFEKVYELAQRPVDHGLWELIQAKFISGDTALRIAGVVYKSHPYWPAISDFFHQVWK